MAVGGFDKWTARAKGLLPSTGIVLAIGTVMAILGPYNTQRFDWPGVWFYWTGLMAVGWTASSAMQGLLDRWIPDWPKPAYGFLLSIGISVPVSAGVILVEEVAEDGMPVSYFPMVFFFVWVISAVLVTITLLIEHHRAAAEAAAEAPSEASRSLPPGSALAEKMPVRLRTAPLVALQAEDHYLRVHTASGDALILMRLSDAVADLGQIDGARTHRSWWVAREAVATVERGDGRARLTLSTGVTAPVSRTYAPKLREAGWF